MTKGFFETVRQMADDLALLIDLCEEAFHPNSYFDHGLFRMLPRLEKKHGKEFPWIRTVLLTMHAVWVENDLRGINEVYDPENRKKHPWGGPGYRDYWIFNTGWDLVTPIIERLRDDILNQMFLDEDVANRIFFSRAPADIARKIHILRTYATKLRH